MVEPVNLDEFRSKPTSPLETGAGGGDSSGMDPWQQTVETRLGELRTDMRGVSSKLDSQFLWLLGVFGAGFVLLAGLVWNRTDTKDMTAKVDAVTQQLAAMKTDLEVIKATERPAITPPRRAQ